VPAQAVGTEDGGDKGVLTAKRSEDQQKLQQARRSHPSSSSSSSAITDYLLALSLTGGRAIDHIKIYLPYL
jgi:hypothetical protein